VRVIVTGMVATYPVGGVAWDYLQYLGCDVWYLEDTGQWVYDPAAQDFTADLRRNARYLNDALAYLDPALTTRWSVRDPMGAYHGLDRATVESLCAGADLFLNVSGSCWLRDAYRAAKVAAFVDTDPAYNQAKLALVDAGGGSEEVRQAAELMRRHDVFFTLGEHVGAPDCLIPTAGLEWHPTRQPVMLDQWAAVGPPGDAFTTVMSWKIEPDEPVIDGTRYGGKASEFVRIEDLPSRTPETLAVAVSGDAPRAALAAKGWQVVDGGTVSATMDDYRRYLAGSRGELSIAKHAYVGTRSGWFSTRSAAYLACGRPVVVQDTGWTAHIPPGAGVHAFCDAGGAAAGLASIRGDYAAAARYARDIAAEYFEATRVCRRLLTDAGL
jgi:hypothetical protein